MAVSIAAHAVLQPLALLHDLPGVDRGADQECVAPIEVSGGQLLQPRLVFCVRFCAASDRAPCCCYRVVLRPEVFRQQVDGIAQIQPAPIRRRDVIGISGKRGVITPASFSVVPYLLQIGHQLGDPQSVTFHSRQKNT